MPTRTIELTPDLDDFIAAEVASGRYATDVAVISAALGSLQDADQEHQRKLASLHKALDEGFSSGVVEGNPFERIEEARRARLAIADRAVAVA